MRLCVYVCICASVTLDGVPAMCSGSRSFHIRYPVRAFATEGPATRVIVYVCRQIYITHVSVANLNANKGEKQSRHKQSTASPNKHEQPHENTRHICSHLHAMPMRTNGRTRGHAAKTSGRPKPDRSMPCPFTRIGICAWAGRCTSSQGMDAACPRWPGAALLARTMRPLPLRSDR